MTNDEKINLIGQKIVLLSNNLDKYKNELAQLQSELNALKEGKTVAEKITPIVIEKKIIEPVKSVDD